MLCQTGVPCIADINVLILSQPITVINRSNHSEVAEAMFHLERVLPPDSGTWVCSIETVAGMVEKAIQVMVKGNREQSVNTPQ